MAWPRGSCRGSDAPGCPARLLPWQRLMGSISGDTWGILGHMPSRELCGLGHSGTDEDTIIDIITHRSNTQRQQIRQVFKSHFGRVRASAWALSPHPHASSDGPRPVPASSAQLGPRGTPMVRCSGVSPALGLGCLQTHSLHSPSSL